MSSSQTNSLWSEVYNKKYSEQRNGHQEINVLNYCLKLYTAKRSSFFQFCPMYYYPSVMHKIFKTAIRQEKYLGKKIKVSFEFESHPAVFSKTLYITDTRVLKLKINIIIFINIIIKLGKLCSVLS